VYFLSSELETGYGDFEEIWNRIGNNDNNGGGV
jgi:hypothetical protein